MSSSVHRPSLVVAPSTSLSAAESHGHVVPAPSSTAPDPSPSFALPDRPQPGHSSTPSTAPPSGQPPRSSKRGRPASHAGSAEDPSSSKRSRVGSASAVPPLDTASFLPQTSSSSAAGTASEATSSPLGLVPRPPPYDSHVYYGLPFFVDPVDASEDYLADVLDRARRDGFFSHTRDAQQRTIVRLPDFVMSVVERYRSLRDPRMSWQTAAQAFQDRVVHLLNQPAPYVGSVAPSVVTSDVLFAIKTATFYYSIPELDALDLLTSHLEPHPELAVIASRGTSDLPRFRSAAAANAMIAATATVPLTLDSQIPGLVRISQPKILFMVDFERSLEGYLFLLEKAGWTFDSVGHVGHPVSWPTLAHISSYMITGFGARSPAVAWARYVPYTINRLLKCIVALLVASRTTILTEHQARSSPAHDAPGFLHCLLTRPSNFMARTTFARVVPDPQTQARASVSSRPLDLEAACRVLFPPPPPPLPPAPHPSNSTRGSVQASPGHWVPSRDRGSGLPAPFPSAPPAPVELPSDHSVHAPRSQPLHQVAHTTGLPARPPLVSSAPGSHHDHHQTSQAHRSSRRPRSPRSPPLPTHRPSDPHPSHTRPTSHPKPPPSLQQYPRDESRAQTSHPPPFA